MVCVLSEFVTALTLRNFMGIAANTCVMKLLTYSCTWNVTEIRLLCVLRHNWSRLSSLQWLIFSHHNLGWNGKLLVNGFHYRTNIAWQKFLACQFSYGLTCNKVSCWNELSDMLAWPSSLTQSSLLIALLNELKS